MIREAQGRGVKVHVCAIGRKAVQFFRRLSGIELVASATHLGDPPHVDDLIGPIKVMLDLTATRRSTSSSWSTTCSSTP